MILTGGWAYQSTTESCLIRICISTRLRTDMKGSNIRRTFTGIMMVCFLAGQFSVRSYSATTTSQSDPYAEVKQIDQKGEHITNTLLAVSGILLVVAILMPSNKKANGNTSKNSWRDDSAKNFTSRNSDLPNRKVADSNISIRNEGHDGACIKGNPMSPYPVKIDICG